MIDIKQLNKTGFLIPHVATSTTAIKTVSNKSRSKYLVSEYHVKTDTKISRSTDSQQHGQKKEFIVLEELKSQIWKS